MIPCRRSIFQVTKKISWTWGFPGVSARYARPRGVAFKTLANAQSAAINAAAAD